MAAVIVLTKGEAQLDRGVPLKEAVGLDKTVTQLLPVNVVSALHPQEFVTTTVGQYGLLAGLGRLYCLHPGAVSIPLPNLQSIW